MSIAYLYEGLAAHYFFIRMMAAQRAAKDKTEDAKGAPVHLTL